MRINWNEIVEKIKVELEVYKIEGYKPTLRSMFYRLYTKKLIPNTSPSYSSLDRATVKARWSGQLPINCFTDNSRKVLNKFNEDYFSPEEIIDNRLKIIRSIPYNYINLIPKWHKQPHYVEVWIEKDAMGNILQTIQTVRDIASDYIEAQKQVIGSFQSQVDRNSGNNNGVWDWFNPQKIAENHAVMVNNFTSYLLNTSNLINNALASNMRVYNTALEQTRDNLKACAKTNTNFIQSVNSQNKEINSSSP